MEVEEQTFYIPAAGTFRPFSLSAGVKQHSYSQPLQRAATDFGADRAFGKVNEKLKEHYGISLPDHAGRTITLKHAAKIGAIQEKELGQIKGTASKVIISETDGSMVPIVAINEVAQDKRKEKQVQYREARLTLAHKVGELKPTFSATLGNVELVGRHMKHCIDKVGIGRETKIHAVGDGALWISNQLEEHFGKQATYLIDFYHVCEYIAAAAPHCAKGETKGWIEEQKELLKNNKAVEILRHLHPYRESQEIEEKDAPVRTCYRYLQNRLHQLDYKNAIANDLPIGSGEIESAHRYIIQSRLKIQGAWWLEVNADNMLALQTNRANNEWANYWAGLAA